MHCSASEGAGWETGGREKSQDFLGGSGFQAGA